ncbi:Protein of unknown function (DUF1700) [Promicromonospora umidemergens]|uniref:DUF1700 domain-containing protein n=1 Tax=Promicromonospora umidemergens TaxID=629679 RepID=A0ABP8Y7G5_9MICO|nr:DUF1700 domain-containing protein [Promicromonospora umidemergens]MCP2282459.1 Protein of unknown function (DUF1700) [Promicromonospora umidemergens]
MTENITMTERTAMNANTEGAYLRDVGKRLRALTPEQRDAVLDDVRAHFADAADAGRTPEQAAESLGDPAQFTERVRTELGHERGQTDRMRRVLQWLATGVAVFSAMFVSFWHPDDSLPMPNTQFEAHGFGIVLLSLVPALIAALPNFASSRARTVFTAAVAIMLSVVSFTFPEGWAFAPTAWLAWAALVVPVIARNGPPAAGWRIAGGVLAVLPMALGVGGALVGSWGLTLESVLYTAVVAALGVLMALGKPWAGIILAVVGVAALVYSALDPGMLTSGVWWAGGLFITLGASQALMHARPRTPGRM